jgi:hypothetical protein
MQIAHRFWSCAMVEEVSSHYRVSHLFVFPSSLRFATKQFGIDLH